MERVAPGSKRFVCYGDFTNDADRAHEISEVHFCLARLFAGLMAVLLALYCIYLPFIAALVAFVIMALMPEFRPTDNVLHLLF